MRVLYMEKKVLFICKDRVDSYGKSIGLVVSASFVARYLESLGVESKLVRVVDGNGIDREVYSYKPDIVVLEAIWVTPEKIRELVSIPRYKHIIWVIRIHSKLPFLANEGIAFPWLVEYREIQKRYGNLQISANSKIVCNDLKATLGIEYLFLPNIYYPETSPVVKKAKKCSRILDIGCFGALRPMKNQLIQAIAAIEYGNERGLKIRFHMNSDRQEQNGGNVYKNIKALFESCKPHELVEHGWMSHNDFVQCVRTMDLGLQVSMSETFNIVAADFVWNNVPIIGSRDIDWLPCIFRADPNSSEDIKEKMNLIMSTLDPCLYRLNNLALDWYNYKAKNKWEIFLKTS
jgi:hypothetical protein